MYSVVKQAVWVWTVLVLLAPLSSSRGEDVLSDGSGERVTQCYAPDRPGREHIAPCIVDYRNLMTLICPDLSIIASQWWKEVDSNHSTYICGPECYLNDDRELTNSDTGVYFCQVPVGNGSQLEEHYVQLTILAPPSLENVQDCNIVVDRQCSTASVSGYPTEDVWITAAYRGVGPFHVQWYHNGSRFNCADYSPHCQETSHYNATSGTHKSVLKLLGIGGHVEFNDSGRYNANVSNAYGWNVSSTSVTFECHAPYPPHPVTKFATKTLKRGHAGNVSCQIEIGDAFYAACYAKKGESLQDLNKSDRCVVCQWSAEGPCGFNPTIPGKKNWKVSLHHLNDCQYTVVTTVHIDKVSEDDEGKLICTWDVDRFGYSHNYTTVTVKVDKRHHHHLSPKDLTLSIVLPVIFAALFVALMAAVVFAVRERQKRKNRKRKLGVRPPPRGSKRSTSEKLWVCAGSARTAFSALRPNRRGYETVPGTDTSSGEVEDHGGTSSEPNNPVDWDVSGNESGHV